MTVGQFLTGEPLKWEDTRSSDPWVFKGRQWVGETRFFDKSFRIRGDETPWRSTITEPVCHIVEVPGGIEKMAESTPTDFYYGELRKSLSRRYPEADRFLLDHLVSLEAFLDKSIIFGFSYGVAKAELCSTGGRLLGRQGSGSGAVPGCQRLRAVEGEAPHPTIFGMY